MRDCNVIMCPVAKCKFYLSKMLKMFLSKRFTVLVVKWQQLGACGPGGVLHAETGARVQRVVSGPDKGHQ